MRLIKTKIIFLIFFFLSYFFFFSFFVKGEIRMKVVAVYEENLWAKKDNFKISLAVECILLIVFE